MFRSATDKEGELIVEGDKVRFISTIGGIVAGDDCCDEVAIKCSYHHSWLYFLDAIKGF